ncbi:hypothetical protein E2493_16300 [Sphingomonas parva]|uniref:TonB C-terminal domain-containing protein n=1 Tax=Sphingomonas parva TaxID=2555898 RepID=A0A4Y8ZPS4_9SPHN|nr:hypothetical protein [Sphingomonas parva]TFI57262.1 hypothetical protein E2493_16300 [Sphingomonas parva]
MSSGLCLRSTGRAAALLAGVSLAAMSSGASADDRALLGVSIIVEPSCAVSAPSRIEKPQVEARGSARGAEMLDIACTSGTSWSATTDEQAEPAEALASADREARPQPRQYRDAEPAKLIRITVRY